jgi:hypothetical protein
MLCGGEEPEKVLGGNKVTSFYHNISDPSSPLHVTVDRHAHDIAIGNPFIGAGGKGGVPKTANASGNKPMSEDLGLSAMGRYKQSGAGLSNARLCVAGPGIQAFACQRLLVTW